MTSNELITTLAYGPLGGTTQQCLCLPFVLNGVLSHGRQCRASVAGGPRVLLHVMPLRNVKLSIRNTSVTESRHGSKSAVSQSVSGTLLMLAVTKCSGASLQQTPSHDSQRGRHFMSPLKCWPEWCHLVSPPSGPSTNALK